MRFEKHKGLGMSKGLPWYLAQVKPQSYRIAERNLQRQSFQSFLPLVNKTETSSGRFITKPKPLFPGYIFVSCDVQAGDASKINSTLGITRLVSIAERPIVVPTEIVKSLFERCASNGVISEDFPVTVGDEVRVLTGPFADFVATIEQIDEARRIWVLINLMGRQTRVGLEDATWEVG